MRFRVRGDNALAEWQDRLSALLPRSALIHQHTQAVVLQRLQEAVHSKGWHRVRGLAAWAGQVGDRHVADCELQERHQQLRIGARSTSCIKPSHGSCSNAFGLRCKKNEWRRQDQRP